MKKPYLTQEERMLYHYDTIIGNLAMLRFKWLVLGRALYKERVSFYIALVLTICLLIIIAGVM